MIFNFLKLHIRPMAIIWAVSIFPIQPATGGESRFAAAVPDKEVEAAELPPPPPSPAMEEKFRRLQKEMARQEPAAKATSKDNSAKEPVPQSGIALGTLAIQILFGLAFVLLLAVVSIRGLKRIQGKLLSKSGKGGDIFEVLETCHLGTRQRVVALRINEDVGIIGVSEQGISLLTVLKEPANEIKGIRPGESNSQAFSENLNKLLDRFKKPKRVSDMINDGAA